MGYSKMKILIFIAGMIIGAFIGIALHCMLIIAKEEDEKC